MTCLLTWWGTVLCREPDGASIVHRPLAELGTARPVPLSKLNDLNVSAPDARGTVTMSKTDGVLSADADGRVACVVGLPCDRSRFLPISHSDLETLRFITGNRWVNAFSKVVATATIGEAFCVSVGERAFPLHGNTPLRFWNGDRRENPRRFSLYRDNWKIDEFVLFKPLIVTVVYGREEIIGMLEILLWSLDALGGYDGEILIRGDRPFDEFQGIVLPQMRNRTHVENLGSLDRLAWTLARYGLVDWPRAWEYQPILYLDADVTVDRPIEKALIDVVLAEAVCVQEESYTSVSVNVAVGADLCREDGMQAETQKGFNAGIMGIPNLREHWAYLAKVKETIQRFYLGKDIERYGFVDQPVANYVATKAAPVNMRTLTKYIRYTRLREMQGGEEPRGFVHFWGSGEPPTRVATMREYLNREIEAVRDPHTAGRVSSASVSREPL